MKFDIPTLIYDLDSFIQENPKYRRGFVRSSVFRAYLRTRCGEAQKWKCVYCHCDMVIGGNSKKSITLEHVVPISKGGENSYENCVAACKKCNNGRGDSDLDENMSIVVKPDLAQYKYQKRITRCVRLIREGHDFDVWYSKSGCKQTPNAKNEFWKNVKKELENVA